MYFGNLFMVCGNNKSLPYVNSNDWNPTAHLSGSTFSGSIIIGQQGQNKSNQFSSKYVNTKTIMKALKIQHTYNT